MIDKSTLARYSLKYKIDQYTVLREYIQIVFLNYLFQEKEAKQLTFKGGTALRLLYNSPRFSEDLDFNAKLDVDQIRNLLNKVVTNTSKLVDNIELKELNTLQGFSAKLYFKSDISSMPLTIKLDFSFRENSIDEIKKTISTELPIQIYSLINVFSAEEILAEKIRTLFQRVKGRDIYDIWFLLNIQTLLDMKMVNKKLELINKKFNYNDLLNALNDFKQKQLENDLFKFLPINQRQIVSQLIEFIKNHPQIKKLTTPATFL
ncbi:MAG: hypothetical protein COU65_04160 [Candidatus Pacebacteria bacterium CG10_big_fil_rev_8_21_14_0_10_42_12]|nr:nucleotidyl transferase AbiEii/AbiGii toxin family protein [Candidatus Paceibacterota bacterium]PIR62294.1 MAG: hypothetical protein COU65_04160 [Candidatus Pacebacteria bacterium CG10_big_fil_rev_8_21_14_0_10_42_12]